MFDGIDPFSASPGELLAAVTDAEPGPMVWSTLLMIDVAHLSPEDAVTFLQIHERVAAWWASVQMRALVAAASPEPRVEEFTVLIPDSDEERSIRIAEVAREEVAAAVRWSTLRTQDLIDTARLLAGPLTGTSEALALGEISMAHARVVAEHAERLPGWLERDPAERARFAKACTALEKRVLPVARRGGVSATRAAARRAVARIDADGALRRREGARCTRDVYLVDETDGIGTLIARLDALTARAVLAAVRAAAGAGAAAGEAAATAGERRAEALASLILHPGSGVAVTAEVQVAIPLDQLAALVTDSVDAISPGAIGSELDDLARLLADPAVQCTLRPVVTHPSTGHVLDVGRRRYDLPPALRRLIVTRDRTCRFPGCNRSAVRAQIDHATAWDDGGPTDVANLGALCVRHHQLKTFAGWDISQSDADGSCTWRSPQGRRYDHDPPPF